MPAKKKATSKTKRTPTKKASPKKESAGKTASKATGRAAGHSATSASSAPAKGARRGDRIVIDSVHVGSPAREGEILKIVAGELTVSYQVKWGDGHETFITPAAGTAHIVRT